MKRIGFGTLLASTIAMSGAASGQAVVSGDVATGTDLFDSSTSPNRGPAVAFQFTVADGNAVGIDFQSRLAFTDRITFFDGHVDITDPASVGSSRLAGFIGFGQAASDFTVNNFLPNAFVDGQDFTVAVSCARGCTADLSFMFIVLGVVIAPLGPTSDEELAALLAATGGSARLVILGADGVARDAGQVSIATRGNQVTFTRVADGTGAGEVTLSTQGAPGMMGNLYTWAEVTGFRSTEFGASGAGTLGGSGLQIGADMAIGPDMVAGLSLGYSEVSASDGGFSSSGTYTHLQPYFAYRSGAWTGNASLIYGMGQFDQTSVGGTGSADVTLTALTFEGGYDYALSQGFTATPTLGLIHGREEIEGTAGTLAGTSDAVTFSQLSLGGRITHDGADGTLFAGLHADYLTQEVGSILARDLLASDGWTARVEVGGEMALSNGMELSTGLELSGLGGDMRTVSGGVRVALRF